MLPDNLFSAGRPIQQVLDAQRRTGRAAVLLAAIGASDAARKGPAGRARCRLRDDGLYDVLAVAPKGRSGDRFDLGIESAAVTPIGRMAFDAAVFDLFEAERQRLAPGEELDDVPVLQRLAAQRPVLRPAPGSPILDRRGPQG